MHRMHRPTRAEMSFLGIDNIHHVRGALARLREHFDTADSKDLGEAHGPSRGGAAGAVGGEEGGGGGGGGGVGGGGGRGSDLVDMGMDDATEQGGNFYWLKLISTLMVGAVRIVRCIQEHNTSVMVHCTDGWDRTPQLTAMAQLLMDPYYRSLKGFAILVEKVRFTMRRRRGQQERYLRYLNPCGTTRDPLLEPRGTTLEITVCMACGGYSGAVHIYIFGGCHALVLGCCCCCRCCM